MRRLAAIAPTAVSGIPGLTMRSPAGTFYAYVACGELLRSAAAVANGLRDDRDVAPFLLDKSGVVVLPAADCGLSPFLRLHFPCTAPGLDTALAPTLNPLR